MVAGCEEEGGVWFLFLEERTACVLCPDRVRRGCVFFFMLCGER